MQFDRIIVNPIWPWPLVLAVVAVLFAVVLTTYPQRVRHLPPGQRRLLLGLRLAAALLLAAAVLRPEIQLRSPDERESALYVLVDRSRSTQTADAPGQKSRREAMIQTIAENRELLEAFAEEHEVRLYDFAEQLDPVDKLEPVADGPQTAFGPVLESLERDVRSDRRSVLLVLSDGAERTPPGQNVDARTVARRLGRSQVPIYTIGYGGAGLSESLDVSIEDLEVDSHPFEKNVVPVRAKVRVNGTVGRRIEVRLLVEDRAGKQPGEAGEMKVPPATRTSQPLTHVEPTRDGQVLQVELSYVPLVPGEFKIAVEAVPVEGELRLQNNQQSTIITVQRGGISILYFDHPLRPEQKWIRFANKSKKIQLDFQPLWAGQLSGQSGVAGDLFAAGRYDAYIIGDVPAALFQEEVLDLRELRRRIDEGSGLLMIGGRASFGPGGYAASPLADVLPVAMLPGPAGGGDALRLDPAQHHTQELQMVPTRSGLNHFIMRLDAPEKNRERWLALTPMNGANRLRRKNPAVEILAESAGPDPIPLLFTSEPGQARVMAFAGDSTWRWVLGGHEDAHQRFWQQMLLYLARKEQDGDQPVWVRVEPRNFGSRQPVEIALGARDAEGQPLPDAELAVEILPPGGEPVRLSVQSREDEHFATFTGTEAAGDYWVRASGTRDGASLGPDAWTRFVVDSRDLELDNPAADYAFLDAISEQSGGRRLQPEDLRAFLQQLVEQGLERSDDLTRVNRISLWDGWPLLGLFVALMTLEWFLRKRRGLV